MRPRERNMDRQTLSIMKACEVLESAVARSTTGFPPARSSTSGPPADPSGSSPTRCGAMPHRRPVPRSRRQDRPRIARVSLAAGRRPPGRRTLGQELQALFHRLNNQLGIILAHAELLEAKASDDANRARAAQIVSGALDAMGTAERSVKEQNPRRASRPEFGTHDARPVSDPVHAHQSQNRN